MDAIGTAVVTGALSPGDVVPAEHFADQLGASRSVVREAVRVLESMGLVESRRRVGITVLDRARWNVFHPDIIRWRLAADDSHRVDQLASLSDLRGGIEPHAAALAARRATPQQCADLAEAVRHMHLQAERGDLHAYLVADIAFHDTLLAASGNEMVAALGGVVAEVLRGRTEHDLMPAHPNPEAIRLHGEVAAAVQVGDAARARTAMESIIDEATAALADELDT